jgi:hypothetical protein
MYGWAGGGIREIVIESNPYRTVLSLDQAQIPPVPAAVRLLVRPVLEHVNRTESPNPALVYVPTLAASTIPH